MIELKSYTVTELAAALHIKADKQQLDKKLNNLGIVYCSNGHGKTLTYEITEIKDEFKVFCILDLDFSASTDFHRLAYFLYLFFNDDDFQIQPFAEMEKRLNDRNSKVSRQTLSTWKKKLVAKDLFINSGEYRYYSVSNEERREISHELYSQVWKEHYKLIDMGYRNAQAFSKMYKTIGGRAVKRPLIDMNGFYTKTIDRITELAARIIDDEVKTVQSSFTDSEIE